MHKHETNHVLFSFTRHQHFINFFSSTKWYGHTSYIIWHRTGSDIYSSAWCDSVFGGLAQLIQA